MAEDQVGTRKEESYWEWFPWFRIFGAFKVAMDPKKLMLASGGILTMAFGWWLLALIFFYVGGTEPPQMIEYKPEITRNEGEKSEAFEKRKQEARIQAWNNYKQALNSWNLRYKLTGPVLGRLDKASEKALRRAKYHIADFVNDADEFDNVSAEVEKIRKELGKRLDIIKIDRVDDKQQFFRIGKTEDDQAIIAIPFDSTEDNKLAQKLFEKLKVTAQDLLQSFDPKSGKFKIPGIEGLSLPDTKQAKERWNDFVNYIREAPTLTEIEKQAEDAKEEDAVITRVALNYIKVSGEKYKPSGWLATWPWFEDRGPNPYLMVTKATAQQQDSSGAAETPFGEGGLTGWFYNYQLPVLMEPLYKFLSPVIYLFHPAATGWNRIYLILVIIWTLATWAIFGGAITRMAAVQIARPNEKVGLVEALKFTWTRKQSYIAAPVLPLVLLAILTLFLFIFGIVVGWTFFVGDLIAAITFPLTLLVGVVMAVVLVGLIGWPLMYSTISAEGSDSFDAISRSYSYVYQAPWQYLWYCFIAVIYGAALIFFVGLMGSLTVYLAKWGMSLAYFNEPTYFYYYAPTSFGWRDLLLYQSVDVTSVPTVNSLGEVTYTYDFKNPDDFGITNTIGAFFVGIWIGILFLFVVGFGYSYFWSVSAVVYLLMRRNVDDTDIDEIHLEEEVEPPYTSPTPPADPTGITTPGGTSPLTMVDPPAQKSSEGITKAPDPTPPADPSPAVGDSTDNGTPESSTDDEKEESDESETESEAEDEAKSESEDEESEKKS